MLDSAPNAFAAKMINRILDATPAARVRLRAHAGKRVSATIGPVTIRLGVAENGRVEPASTGNASNAAPDAAFQIPLVLIPRLLRKDESAYREVQFTGDSEFAHTLSTLARDLDWDIEEDLSQLLGGGTTADIIAHRAVGTVQALRAFRDDAGQRFTENMAEYLVHERQAFISKDELESFARDNEMLRDDVARLEARCNLLALHNNPT